MDIQDLQDYRHSDLSCSSCPSMLSQFDRAAMYRYLRCLGVGRIAICAMTTVLLLAISVPCANAKQNRSNADGFNRVEGKHITIITDLPIDDDLRQMPEVFDQAMPVWCEQFVVDPNSVAGWKTTLYLMLDRKRFKAAGMIPDKIPNFEFGWQYGNDLWVMETQSPYYRRHLMLHEGTHWFMYRKYGVYDTPWICEGMSELMGTHRWIDGKLTMEVIPKDRLDVPFWGRIKIVREQCTGGLAPSMEEILRYGDTAHRNVDAYAWSWTLTVFLKNHPDTAKVFDLLLTQPAMNSREVDKWLRSRLSSKLPRVRAAWRAFVTELDYGYSPEPGLLQLSDKTEKLAKSTEFKIDCAKGWQATGISVKKDSTVNLKANGSCEIAQKPKPWICTADGVTLEYHRGQPLGKLMMVVLAPQPNESATEFIEFIPVGSQLQWQAKQDGELFFKVNESSGSLSDNTGELTIQISPK